MKFYEIKMLIWTDESNEDTCASMLSQTKIVEADSRAEAIKKATRVYPTSCDVEVTKVASVSDTYASLRGSY